jgi:hypothetical protein
MEPTKSLVVGRAETLVSIHHVQAAYLMDVFVVSPKAGHLHLHARILCP